MKWALKLSQGLSKTASGFSLNLASILKGKQIDKQVMEDLEDLLISSDFGVNISREIMDSLAEEKLNNLDQENSINLHSIYDGKNRKTRKSSRTKRFNAKS